MTKLITAALALWQACLCLADIAITDVTAQQRYPWDGKVDISYTVSGARVDGLVTSLKVMAVDQATHVTNIATVLSGDVSLDAGTHEIVWDMGAQGLSLQSSNMEFYVLCETDVSLLDYIDWRIASAAITNGSVTSYGGANLLYGKHIWIFGDSLNADAGGGAHRMADWLEMVAGVKCTVFAEGGTLTYPNGVSNGQDRVMHAIEQQEAGLVAAPDIILYEDINDFKADIDTRDGKYGTLADKPWMLMQYADFFDTTYESHNAAEAAWNANFDTLVASVENKIAGTMARMKYIDGANTKYYVRYYYGTSDATEFATRSNWKYFFEYPKLTACYKGLIERLMAKYPTARMHILGFPLTTKVFPDPDRTLNPGYYFEDGTLDIYGAKNTAGTRPYCQDELMGLLGDIAKLYGIGFIDVARETQVNLVNIETWYRSGDVHPEKDTYKRWAEVIYKELLK